MMLSFDRKLQNYADLAINIGVALQPGQRLIISAPVESAPLVRLIVASAYKVGARLVDVMWTDDAITLARFNHAPRDSFEEYPTWRAKALLEAAEEGAAFLSVLASDPDLLKEQDPDLVTLTQRVHQTQRLPFSRKIMSDAVNWCIIAQPEAKWAAKLFPDISSEVQRDKLWEAIFRACRVDQADPIAAWQRHVDNLAARRDYLNARQYAALKFTAPGTDITLGLPAHHQWHGGQKKTLSGIDFIPNIPTEEVFTMPHREQAEGVVSSSKPLSYAGVLIENFKLTFSNGRVTNVSAKIGESVLKKLIETDEGAARLGEIALVPASSPIAKSGLLFFNTLFDENAASHVALGRAYRFCVADGTAMSDEAFTMAGGNDSLTHVDFMIGSEMMDIDGITASGEHQPVMRAGEWTVEA